MTASKHAHTAEFREETVRLVISSRESYAEVARNLGIPPYLVARWKQKHEQQGAAGRPRSPDVGSQHSVSRKRGSRSSSENSK